jgi:cytidylate kinase
MSSTPDAGSGELKAAAEQRMERWLLSPELKEHMQHSRDVRKPAETGSYISLSREAGSGGVRIARVVGQQLGWDVLHKELLDFMTERYNLPRDMLEVVDETRANWFHDVIGSFIDKRIVSHDSFVVHLERIIYLAALHGNVIFVGRGAQFVLPRQHGLAVRVVAPKKKRIDAMMQRKSLSRPEATALVDRLDSGRTEFCRRHFHHDITDPLEYDLVINTDRLSDQAAAELIVDAFCRARREGAVAEGAPKKLGP